MSAATRGLIAAVVLACAGCASITPTHLAGRPLEGQTGDPVADANWYFRYGDYSLAAINAVNLVIPSIGGDDEYVRRVGMKYGVHYLNGVTTDSVRYGETYNHTMLRLRGCDETNLFARCKI